MLYYDPQMNAALQPHLPFARVPSGFASLSTRSTEESDKVVSEVDANVSRVGLALLKELYTLLAEPEAKSCRERCYTLIPKIAACGVCYLTEYPYLVAARRVSSNPVIGNLLAGGEFTSWGTFYSLSCVRIMDEYSVSRRFEQINPNSSRRTNSVYWIGITILSLAVQIPDIYISYTYTDHSIFWPALIGCVYSSFTMNSMHALTQKIARTDNVVSRCLYRRTNKCQIFKSKENFCELIQDHFTAFLKTADSNTKELFFQILNNRSETPVDRAKAFLFMLSKGLEKKMAHLSKHEVYVGRRDKCIRITGTLLFLTKYYLDGKLTYNASKLLVDDDYFSAFLIVLTVTPNIYLGIQMCSNTFTSFCSGVFRLARGCRSGIWEDYCSREQVIKRTGFFLSTLLSVFSLGSTWRVLQDNIGFEDHMLISLIILGFTALLVINTMSTLSDAATDELLIRLADRDERMLREAIQRVEDCISKVRKMSAENFEGYISSVEGTVGEKLSLIEKLANAEEYEELRQKLSLLLTPQLQENDEDDQEELEMPPSVDRPLIHAEGKT